MPDKPKPIEDALETLAASNRHWRAGSSRSFAMIRKEAGLFCGSFLRQGEVLACVKSIHNLEDWKDLINEFAL